MLAMRDQFFLPFARGQYPDMFNIYRFGESDYGVPIHLMIPYLGLADNRTHQPHIIRFGFAKIMLNRSVTFQWTGQVGPEKTGQGQAEKQAKGTGKGFSRPGR